MVPTRPHAGPPITLGGVMGARHSGVGGSLCTAFRAREHPEIGAEPAESLFPACTWHWLRTTGPQQVFKNRYHVVDHGHDKRTEKSRETPEHP